MKYTRTIGCQSSQVQQVMLLKSLLAIVGDRKDSENIWVYEENESCDVLIIDYDDQDTPLKSSVSRSNAVVPMSRDEDRLKDHSLSLLKPLRSREIVVLLDALDKKLAKNTPEKSPNISKKEVAVMEGESNFAKEDDNLRKILEILKKRSAELVRVDFDNVHIFIDGKNGRFFLGSGFCFKKQEAAHQSMSVKKILTQPKK